MTAMTEHADQPKRKSFFERATDLFAAPTELFDNIRDTPPTPSTWVIPLLIFCLAAVGMYFFLLTNDAIVAQIQGIMDKQFEKALAEGRMTQAQADQASQFMNPSSPWPKLIQSVSVVLLSAAMLFVMALLYWLVGKFVMKGNAPYMKVVEVVGIVLLVGALGKVVGGMMSYASSSIFADASLAFFVGEFDPENKVHVFLSACNVFTFWSLGLVALGLARLFRKDFPKVLVLVLALWGLFALLALLTGIRLS